MRDAMPSLRSKRFVALVALLGIAGGVTAGIAGFSDKEKVNLRGRLYIAGKTMIDPPPEEPQRTHAYIYIEGPAALQMYRAMKAAERKLECDDDDGRRFKHAGPLECWISADRKDAECDFAVDLASGRLTAGSVC